MISGKVDQRLAAFPGRRVLVVGDSIVDVFTQGTVIGVATETPTLVMRKEVETRSQGGAAFLCRNLLELGARVDFVTLDGTDPDSAPVRDFAAPGLDLAAIAARVRVEVTARLPGADALVVSDYRHGLLPPDLAGYLLSAARGARKPVYVDSQVAQNLGNHADYRGGAIFCLNLTEARCVDPRFHPMDDPAAWQGLWRALEPTGKPGTSGNRGHCRIVGLRRRPMAGSAVPSPISSHQSKSSEIITEPLGPPILAGSPALAFRAHWVTGPPSCIAKSTTSWFVSGSNRRGV
jgi:hypothetical protein